MLDKLRALPKWAQWMPVVIVLLSALLIGALIDAKQAKSSQAENHTAKQGDKGRRTFTASVQEMVDRYNNIAAQIDRSLLLPPASALEDGGKNEKFHVLRHAVKPNIYVSIEVDNATGHPFSIGAWATAANNNEIASLLSVLPTVGATIFGKGEKAGILVNQCANSAKAQGSPASVRIEEFEVYCSNAQGLWMAGISVIKDAQ